LENLTISAKKGWSTLILNGMNTWSTKFQWVSFSVQPFYFKKFNPFLVFNVKQGWEPLCEFLNKPIPNEPFPNTNKKEDVDAESISKEVITLGSVAVFYGGLATLGFLAYKYDLKGVISRAFWRLSFKFLHHFFQNKIFFSLSDDFLLVQSCA